jgi:hypothetical protein
VHRDGAGFLRSKLKLNHVTSTYRVTGPINCPILQLEDIKTHEAAINGLTTDAAARQQKIEQLSAEVAQLEETVGTLPATGEAGEAGAERRQLQMQINDVNAQVCRRCCW